MNKEEIISKLVANGCNAENWNNVSFPESLDTSRVKNVNFLGKCEIGNFDSYIDIDSISFPTGIYNATLNNCTVRDNCLIQNVGDIVSNYEIKSNAIVRNCGTISHAKGSHCGLNTRIAVLNENGGRSILLSPCLTSNIVYFYVLYRHNPALISKLENAIKRENDKIADRGVIEEECRIIGCKELRNIYVGEGARLNYCSLLSDGYINSFKAYPVVVSNDVIAKEFVFSPNTVISSGVIIERCFVGEATKIGNGFSATDCVFTSNCQAFHGEACSIFAGPFTVTHHKSTLLIAGMYSFMNAGSNTNQSNHYYRLGPNHEGKLERGSKTASGSYILWPAITGVFSLVKGKHGGNLDTRMFPFSYLIEQNGETWIYPGMSLKSSGTARDILKWAKRDARIKDSSLSIYQDIINYDIYSPFVLNEVLNGIDVLTKKQHHQRKEGVNYHKFGRAKVHSVAVDEGLELYNMFLLSYIYKVFSNTDVSDDVIKQLASEESDFQWIDASGLWSEKSEITALLDSFNSLSDLHDGLLKINNSYDLKRRMHLAKVVLNRFPYTSICDLIEKGSEASKTLDNLVETDKQREYSDFMKVGYGIDGTKDDKEADFNSVQGIK